MKQIIKLLCFSFLICLLSCSHSQSSHEITGIDSNTIKIAIEDIDDNILLFSDVYTSVDYAILETNEESTLGNINKVEVTKDNDLIIFDDVNGKILRFDSKGNYLNKIGMLGHSNNEYVSPNSIFYDDKSNHVLVYDGVRKCLLHYDLNGMLVHTTPLHKHIGDFAVINENAIAIYANYMDVLEEGQVAYNFEIIDYDGNIKSQYDPYSMEMDEYRPSPTNIFKHYDGKLLFHKYYSPILHSVDEEGLSPNFYIDFMSRQIPVEWLGLKSTQEIDRCIFDKENDVAYCKDFFDTPHVYILKVSRQGYNHYIYIDKKDTSRQLCAISMSNDIMGLVSSFVSAYSRGKCYGVINSDIVDNIYSIINDGTKLEKYKRHWSEIGYEITDQDLSIVKKMKNNQNPTIQICTLK